VSAKDEGAPRQVIHPSMPAPLGRVVDREGSAEEAAARAVRDLASRPWDLAAGPLLRAVLVARGEREHVLALAMHHIVADGWSIRILLREIAALYEARRAGAEAPLAPLPIQYADYAAWQRAREPQGAFDEPLRAWRETLAADERRARPPAGSPATADARDAPGRPGPVPDRPGDHGVAGASRPRLRHDTVRRRSWPASPD
jgi:hypothetical protein